METTTALPAWIGTTQPQPQPDRPISAYGTHIALMEQVYLSIWQQTLDRISLGHKLKDVISDDPREIDLAAFNRWIAKDKKRANEFKEAKRMGTHMVLEEMIEIADGHNSMEDVARSTLRVNTRRLYLKAYNKDVFGDNPAFAESAGNQPITIIIGAVDSPYNKPTIDITPAPITLENTIDE